MRGPFFPGAGTSPFRLEGRDDELRTWHRMLTDLAVFGQTQARHLVVQGVRGVGKTSLLKQFAEDALIEGCLAVRVRCQTSGRESLMERVRHAVDAALEHRDLAAEHGRVVRAAVSTPVGGLEVERELSRPTGLTDTDFMQFLVDATAEVKGRGGTGVALLVDETQYADRTSLVNLSELVSLIGERDADKPPLLLCFAGLPTDTAEKVARSSSHAERVYRTITLGYLDRASTRDALLLPVQQAGGQWEADALERAVEVTGGYPAFIQEYGQAIWELRRGERIDAAVVADGITAARPQIEAYFEGAWTAAPPLARSCLVALAEAGGRARMRELAQALGRGSSSEISWAVEELRQRGTVLKPERGVVVFGRSGMAEWVLEHHAEDQP
ncbi:AAA family ATPase [Auraticoccus monumenti]|uniref:AAA ATPase domain-containing protein n=1 Tax=Auraticoccus monumenti TaxID=675864 RepID=A0A1G7EPJ2_9ACTN|nr:ATP-binding protein [Auraticoccus monumenti]SDE65564.1 AAA ATPase domain-containing protein [Auraticoccus monumenti]